MYYRFPRNAIRSVLRAAAMLVLGSCIAAAGHAAPTAKGKPPAEGSDLRVLDATAADLAEGKRLTEGSCARCHGAEGISASKGTPNIAGQRPAYLHSKLQSYRAGTRADHSMESAVRFLTDDALVQVAAYYASLEPPPPAQASTQAAAGKAAPVIALDPLAAGKSAAAACTSCHGDNGVTKTGGTPSLVAFDPKYFIAALDAYKSDRRKNDMMKALAAGLNDADIKNIAVYFALQKPVRAQTPASGDAAAGKAAAAACAGCHGEQGVSGNPANPSLAGQDAQYLALTLKEYKEGSRKEETMKLAAATLGDKDFVNLAAFYAAQTPRAPKVDKPLALAEWVQRCDRCHGMNGNSSDVRIPSLAAQRADYLQKALRLYQGGQRKGSVMHAMSLSLTDADVDSLSVYYSRQKARSFVFVPVASK